MANISIGISLNTQFGTRGSGNGEFIYPSGLVIANGDLFIIDKQNHRIQQLTQNGSYINQFGSVGSGNDQFFFPEGVLFDGSFLLIVDGANNRIKRHQTNGIYDSEFGIRGSGNIQFEYPVGISLGYGNQFIVADKGNSRISTYDLGSYAFINSIGSYGTGILNFNFPEGVTIFNNNIIITDSGNKEVKIYNQSGVYQGTINYNFNTPVDVVNIDDTILVVIDRTDHQLIFFNNTYQLIETYGSFGSGSEQFNFPQNGIYESDKLFITDSGNHRIKILDVVIDADIPIYADEISLLTKQLYPTGRAWWLKYQNTFSKLHEALAFSESRAIENTQSILNSILPDNDNFTEEDAGNWERALGLIIQPNLSLEERKQAILRKYNHPGTISARQHYLYLEGQLQAAGFDVYVYENRVPIGGGDYEVINPVAALHNDFNHNDNVFDNAGITNFSNIANYIDEDKDAGFNFGNDTNLRATIIIGGQTLGTRADVSEERKSEFRELILKIKPAQVAGFLLIDYI